MAAVHLLHAGYTGDRVASSVVLVRDGEALIVADPGMVRSRSLILDPLRELDVAPEAVTHVFLSHHHPDHTINVALFPNGRPGPKLLLQQVEEPKAGKNRMHVDIEVPDIHTEAARLVELGAVRVREAPLSEHGTTWILMTDPEGNEFCVCDSGAGSQ